MPVDWFFEKRQKLINELKASGIKDKKILDAVNKVKRELFIPDEMKKYSYDNNPLPIECGQTISQPYTVAFMTELLEIEQGDKVLEIGTGSGYQAAILETLGAEVFSIERISQLFETTRKRFSEFGLKTRLKCDDGCNGWKEYSPYDKIIVTAGSPKVPKSLINQLKTGGVMVIPVGDEYTQEMYVIKKLEQDGPKPKLAIQKHKYFRFVPLVSSEAWEKGYL